MDQKPKDFKVDFKSIKSEEKKPRGVKGEPGTRDQLYMTNEAALSLAETLVDLATNSEFGVKLDLFKVDRSRKDGSGAFATAYMYVKKTDAGPNRTSKFQDAAFRSVARTVASNEERDRKIAAFKVNKEIK